ncbi:hypothetical protein CERSUDRAFT_95835 [Gelatoporia subvermispora B]|uniref:DUF6533 domain-containing protein n=1 Tax=Ceriporiopsis subvermispora (strain B) TaxID=914234 RepID=M2RCM1_CERS8|nr:hypothetical protein CERSUDRAFT_95835 [Gelatoporia subvermispora B]
MSSDADAEAEFIYNVRIGIVDNYCAIAACIAILYEHLITIADEYELVWGRKRSGATLIFMLNRYCALLFAISLLLTLFDWSTNERYGSLVSTGSFHRNPHAPCVAAKWSIPLHSLFSKSWCTYVGQFSQDFGHMLSEAVIGDRRSWCLSWPWYLSAPICIVMSRRGLLLSRSRFWALCVLEIKTFQLVLGMIVLLIATRACAIAADLLTLVVTWSSTYRIKRDADKANVKASLATLLLRDGTVYFIILLALNAMHMASYLTNTFVNISWFLVPISSILISRFLLNLRQVYHPMNIDTARPSFVRSLYQSQSQMSDLRFASTFIGNMGAPLDYNSFSADMDDDRDATSTAAAEISLGDLGYGLYRADSEQSNKELPQVTSELLRVGLEFQGVTEVRTDEV